MNIIRILSVALHYRCSRVVDFPIELYVRPRDTIDFVLGVEAEFECDILFH